MSIRILLHNQGPLYPGTLLKGKVVCNFDCTTSVRAIKIRCYGREHTEWQTGGKNKTTYLGERYFFQMETKLFEPASSEMHTGTYTYPFTFLLPIDLPSPFEFPYGHIRFCLKGIIDIPLAIDPRTKEDLAIISVLDISKMPTELKLPFQATDTSFMGCCWYYNTDPVRMEAQINKRVFLPGETIRISMELHNMSDDIVEDITVKLVRAFVAHTATPSHQTRFINEDLLKQSLPGIGAHTQQTFDADLHLPLDMAIPNMKPCSFFECLYRVEVTGNTSGFNRDLNLVIAEIEIGHVDDPDWLTRNLQGSSININFPSAPSEFPAIDTVSAPYDNFEASAPPPKYEDVVQEK